MDPAGECLPVGQASHCHSSPSCAFAAALVSVALGLDAVPDKVRIVDWEYVIYVKWA